MVAVCVVANTLFPVTVSIAPLAGEGLPADGARLSVTVRQEHGELTEIPLSAERSAALRARFPDGFDRIAGLPWRQVLAEL